MKVFKRNNKHLSDTTMKVLEDTNMRFHEFMCLYICYLDDGTIKGIVDANLRVVDVDIEAAPLWASIYRLFYDELSPTDSEYNLVKMLMI